MKRPLVFPLTCLGVELEPPGLWAVLPAFLTFYKVCPVFFVPRVTLVALWSAMESSRESSPGAMAVPWRTSPVCTPRSVTSWTGFRRPWPRTAKGLTQPLCHTNANKVMLIQPPVSVPAPATSWLWEIHSPWGQAGPWILQMSRAPPYHLRSLE